MKKFYSFLASAVALATSFTASAASVTIIVDNPSAVDIVKSEYKYDDQGNGEYVYTPIVEPVEDVNVVEATDYLYAYVKAKDGFALTSVVLGETEQLRTVPSDNWSFSVDEYTNGAVYVVSTINLEESRTASVEITVDDPSKIRLTRNGSLGGDVALSAGSQTVKFAPEIEGPFSILAKSSTAPIYYVKHNGEDVVMEYGQYKVDVKDGDKIEIAANFPDIDYMVKVIVADDVKGVFSGLYDASNTALDGNLAEGVAVHAGTSLNLRLNTTDYAVDDVIVNGESTKSTYWSGVIDKDYTFEILAHEFGTYTVDFDVDDPSRVEIYNGYSSYGTEKFDIVAGVNTFEFKESSYGSNIYIAATEGNIVKNVRIVNGENESNRSGGTITVNKGDKVYITSAVKEPDTKLIVWVEPAAVSSIKSITFNEYYGSKVFGTIVPEAGVNVFDYCFSDLSMQMNINVNHPNPIPEGYIAWSPYLSYNEADAYQASYFQMSSYSGMADGDILRIFYEQPEKATVSVSAPEALAPSDIAVEVDTRAVSEWSSMSLFKGSEVKIIPSVAVTCSVDGRPVTADSDGCFSFIVTGDHNVVLGMNTTGIDRVEAEGTAPRVIYNLQGIRMADTDNLPAGIYIIDGKKVAVK